MTLPTEARSTSPPDDRETRTAQRAAERAADRAAHLAAYRRVDPAERAGHVIAPVDPAGPAVRAFTAALAGLGPEQAEARLRTLAEFCVFAEEDPEEMISRIFDRAAYRYVRRTHYQQQILEFSAGVAGTWEERTAAGDVIRAFFLANGHRIAPAPPHWQVWLRMP